MTLLIENQQDMVTEDMQEFFEQVIAETLKVLNLDIDPQVSLLLTDNAEIKELNCKYRDKDQATDVLSFPMLELNLKEMSDLDNVPEENFDPETGEIILGDIVISIERAIEQAAEYGHSVKRELAFLMTHGMLHLLGYDHELGEEEEKIMFDLQEKILLNMNLPRTLSH